jgi:hypothetical protein
MLRRAPSIRADEQARKKWRQMHARPAHVYDPQELKRARTLQDNTNLTFHKSQLPDLPDIDEASQGL